MKLIPPKQRKLLLIEWVDASGPGRAGWEYVDVIEKEGEDAAYLCWSVGWLMGESRTHLALASHRGNLDSSEPLNEQMTGRLMIPKAMVKRRMTLKGFKAR